MERSPNSSPEFEFWMSSNNPPSSSSFSQPENLLSADELFSGGLILPFNTNPPPPRMDPTRSANPPPTPPAPKTISSSPKKWKLMFRPSLREAKRMNPRSANNTELNIHIWPFSRSRSAGNNTSSGGAGSTANPFRGASGRKSCSAPCSRSNSHGDSETAPSSSSATKSATGTATAPKKRGQLTGGIYIGRSVPVWQPRAKNQGNNNGGGGGLKKLNVGINMLNLKNVNTCIGYGSNNVNCQASGCSGEEKDEVAGGDRGGGDVIRGGSLFKFRAIFSKKVHV